MVGVFRICNLVALSNINWRAQEPREDDPLHSHQKDLDAYEVPVEKWVVLARDSLLELDHWENLNDVEDAQNKLHC